MLPKNAESIVQMRRKGMKPDDLVIVSLVGSLPETNHVVIADGPEYDWRWCRGLKICIFGKVGTSNRQTAIAIGANLPAKLHLWDVEAKNGADVMVHIRESSINKREFKISDWSAFLWPWSEWQNREFEK